MSKKSKSRADKIVEQTFEELKNMSAEDILMEKTKHFIEMEFQRMELADDVAELKESSEKILEMKGAVKFLKLSDSTIRRKINAGEIPAKLSGRKYLFKKSELVRYMDRKKHIKPPPEYRPKKIGKLTPQDETIRIALNNILPPRKSGRPKRGEGE